MKSCRGEVVSVEKEDFRDTELRHVRIHLYGVSGEMKLMMQKHDARAFELGRWVRVTIQVEGKPRVRHGK